MEDKIDKILTNVETIQEEQKTIKANVEKILTDNTIIKEQIRSLEYNNDALVQDTRRLKSDLADVQQKLRENWIEVTGIPVNIESKDLPRLLQELARHLGYEIHQDVLCDFFKLRRRPTTVIFIFSQTKFKNEFLAHARKKRLFDTDIFNNLRERSRIYINESLIPQKYQLFKQLKLMQKKGILKFTWMRNGQLYARISESSPVKVIKTSDDINTLKQEASKTTVSSGPSFPMEDNTEVREGDSSMLVDTNVHDKEVIRSNATDDRSFLSSNSMLAHPAAGFAHTNLAEQRHADTDSSSVEEEERMDSMVEGGGERAPTFRPSTLRQACLGDYFDGVGRPTSSPTTKRKRRKARKTENS